MLPVLRAGCVDFGMERQQPFGDGVATGSGTVGGRPVFVFSQGEGRCGAGGERNSRSAPRFLCGPPPSQAQRRPAPVV